MGLFTEAWASSGHQFLIKSNPIQLGDFGKVKIDIDFSDKAYAIGIDKANRHSYYISFMVQNLTHSNQGAEVWLNNKKIGEIHAYPDENQRHWYMQTIILDNIIEDKKNEIEILAARRKDGGNDLYDDFLIKNMILHYNISYRD